MVSNGILASQANFLACFSKCLNDKIELFLDSSFPVNIVSYISWQPYLHWLFFFFFTSICVQLRVVVMAQQASRGVAPVLRYGVQMRKPVCSCFCDLAF